MQVASAAREYGSPAPPDRITLAHICFEPRGTGFEPLASRDGEKLNMQCFQAAKLAVTYHSSYKETDTKHKVCLTSLPITSAQLLPVSSGSLAPRIAFPSAPS